MRDPGPADENADFEVVLPWWLLACVLAIGLGLGVIVTAVVLG